jgi:Flp pilus assembly protein TadD
MPAMIAGPRPETAFFPTVAVPATVKDCDDYLNEAFGAMAAGRQGEALTLLRRAAAKAWGRPEPWYWIGTLHEAAGDRARAAQAYFFALDVDRCAAARAALLRLGYLAD